MRLYIYMYIIYHPFISLSRVRSTTQHSGPQPLETISGKVAKVVCNWAIGKPQVCANKLCLGRKCNWKHADMFKQGFILLKVLQVLTSHNLIDELLCFMIFHEPPCYLKKTFYCMTHFFPVKNSTLWRGPSLGPSVKIWLEINWPKDPLVPAALSPYLFWLLLSKVQIFIGCHLPNMANTREKWTGWMSRSANSPEINKSYPLEIRKRTISGWG